ncbi:hypothetical protein [Pseudobythopirellula maris]|uniref:hypothetical protein n=1 Tax=Pseudobythopirellula maris TaxID=2527991 RepID=UPI0011B7EEE5|nr:hypothetical protein [Pseudobythopirellula maris]
MRPPEPGFGWRREAWPQALLVVAYTLSFVLVPPRPPGGDFDDFFTWLKGLQFGAFMSLPLQCGLWTALAPSPLLLRVPIGVGVCVLLGLVACAIDGSYFGLALFAAMFLPFAAAGAAARHWGKLRLVRRGDLGRSSAEVAGLRFTTRYLMALTFGCAVLLSIGRIALWARGGLGGVAVELAGTFTGFACVAALILPALLASAFVLGTKQRGAAGYGLVLLACFAITFTNATTFRTINPSMQTFYTFWEHWAGFAIVCLGMTLSTVATACLLRYCGYRLVWGKASDG